MISHSTLALGKMHLYVFTLAPSLYHFIASSFHHFINMKYTPLLIILLIADWSCKTAVSTYEPTVGAVQQVAIPRVEKMPNQPKPYVLKDWKKTALEFDKYAYDFSQKGNFLPLIWMDNQGRNFKEPTYGIYTALGDVREGPAVNNGENHEALGALGSIIGATFSWH